MNLLPDDCLIQILEKVLSGINYFYLREVCHKWKQILISIIPYLDKVLDFSNSKITDYAIKKLEGVRNLNLTDCRKITNNSLSYLTNIQSIGLTNTNITENGLKYLTSCQSIELGGYNYSKHIKDNIFIHAISINITSLDICGIKFSSVRYDSFSHLVNLTILKMSNISTPGCIGYFTNLRELTLRSSSLYDNMINSIKCSQKIEYIDFDHCWTFNSFSMIQFTNLKKLILHRTYFICDITSVLNHLEYLDISGCPQMICNVEKLLQVPKLILDAETAQKYSNYKNISIRPILY